MQQKQSLREQDKRFTVRPMLLADIPAAAVVHQAAFVRQRQSECWLTCNFNAFPRMLCYVALIDSACVGYIIWTQKSGFRSEVVLELEQIAVAPECQASGIGRELIERSLPLAKAVLYESDAVLKHILVTTRADNHAQKLYASTLNARVEATLSNLYSADEVIMIARDPDGSSASPGYTTFYLEMNNPHELDAKALPAELSVLEAEVPQYQLNRFLYQLVGASWESGDLDEWTDEQWREKVEDENLRTWVAYYRGSIAGYYELHRPDGSDTEILYFGLAPEFIGRGFGGPLLSHAIRSAWSWAGTERVWVHTCTFDHPSALQNYQARGMRLYDQVAS